MRISDWSSDVCSSDLAQSLADFGELNTQLNAGEVFGARRFRIRQGDLTVGDGVKAQDVQIVLDGGSLTIEGTIDASGQGVGAIRLAAIGDLVVNGALDAHGTGLRVEDRKSTRLNSSH